MSGMPFAKKKKKRQKERKSQLFLNGHLLSWNDPSEIALGPLGTLFKQTPLSGMTSCPILSKLPVPNLLTHL